MKKPYQKIINILNNKMKKNKIICILLILALIVLLFILILNKEKIMTAFVINDFKVGVFAICEEKEDYIYCKDKVFASCNKNLVYVKENFVTCNEQIYKIKEMNLNEEKYPKGWEDPRQKNFLQLWAIKE